MCGIYGIVGESSTQKMIRKLKSLEYRGYDSCGIAYWQNQEVFVKKAVGNTGCLENKVKDEPIFLGIGHTRWATHGAVTETNAHPHTSSAQRFFIVHNGVIENYRKLKEAYGISCLSETDSEVVVHLLDHLIRNHSMLDAMKQLTALLKGNYAIVILDKEFPTRLYFMKNKSPLLIGDSENGLEISSDQNSFGKNTWVTLLNDLDYGYIEKRQIFYFSSGKKREQFFKTQENIVLKKNNHFMLDEILYQKQMMTQIAERYRKLSVTEIEKLFADCEEIVFVGAGSSYYAGRYLKAVYENKLRKRCFAITASEIESFLILNPKTVFLFLSQSGETADLLKAMDYLKQRKHPVIALCNNVHSSVCYQSDYIFPLCAGPEIAVASTKAFMAMLYVGEILVDKTVQISRAPIYEKAIQNALNQEETIRQIAKEISRYKKVFFLAKEENYFIALEGALKLREVSYLPAFAFYSGELKHGSIALIDEETYCLGLLTRKDDERYIQSNLEEIRSRRGKTLLVSTCSDQADILLSDSVYGLIVFLQLLAYHTALVLHRNIDQPRNLAKSVTVY